TWTAEKLKRSIGSLPETKVRENFSRLSGFLAEDGRILKKQANHLLRLVQIYNPRFRETSLKPFLQRLVDHYRAVMTGNIHIRLEMEGQVTAALDEELLKEALVNLVDNALDAMAADESGQLTVSAVPVAEPLRGRISHVLIEVEDSGRGIAQNDLPKIFDPFFTKKEAGKGTGIGLFICKRIIAAHRGKIDVFSRENFGTKMTLTLPVKRKRILI
ncbi:MAG: HAMP domain-containing histidine kinase, partial [bacterium]|nr:HAMP domain-containing histidine kinase [bacterium]